MKSKQNIPQINQLKRIPSISSSPFESVPSPQTYSTSPNYPYLKSPTKTPTPLFSIISENSSFHQITQKPLTLKERLLSSSRCLTKQLTLRIKEVWRRCNVDLQKDSKIHPILTTPSQAVDKKGFDNENNELILRKEDIIGSYNSEEGRRYSMNPNITTKYQIIEKLGQGIFGQVFKCIDLNTNKLVAIKILKNRQEYFRQGLLELTTMTIVNKMYDKKKQYVVEMIDHFLYHGHLCIVQELLGKNIYQYLKEMRFTGMKLSEIKQFTRQLLEGVNLLNISGIVHCDLKPENVLLCDQGCKIIDLGSACFCNFVFYDYIQSRHYRAPEIALGNRYSTAIDMWSVGCIVAEMFLGIPLFPANSEYDLILRYVDCLGLPPVSMITNGRKGSRYFKQYRNKEGQMTYRMKEQFEFEYENNCRLSPHKDYLPVKLLRDIIFKCQLRVQTPLDYKTKENLYDFLKKCLEYDPSKRITPQQALKHSFLTDTLLRDCVLPPREYEYKVYGHAVTVHPDQMIEDTYRDPEIANMDLDRKQYYDVYMTLLRAGHIPNITIDSPFTYGSITPLHMSRHFKKGIFDEPELRRNKPNTPRLMYESAGRRRRPMSEMSNKCDDLMIPDDFGLDLETITSSDNRRKSSAFKRGSNVSSNFTLNVMGRDERKPNVINKNDNINPSTTLQGSTVTHGTLNDGRMSGNQRQSVFSSFSNRNSASYEPGQLSQQNNQLKPMNTLSGISGSYSNVVNVNFNSIEGKEKRKSGRLEGRDRYSLNNLSTESSIGELSENESYNEISKHSHKQTIKAENLVSIPIPIKKSSSGRNVNRQSITVSTINVKQIHSSSSHPNSTFNSPRANFTSSNISHMNGSQQANDRNYPTIPSIDGNPYSNPTTNANGTPQINSTKEIKSPRSKNSSSKENEEEQNRKRRFSWSENTKSLKNAIFKKKEVISPREHVKDSPRSAEKTSMKLNLGSISKGSPRSSPRLSPRSIPKDSPRGPRTLFKDSPSLTPVYLTDDTTSSNNMNNPNGHWGNVNILNGSGSGSGFAGSHSSSSNVSSGSKNTVNTHLKSFDELKESKENKEIQIPKERRRSSEIQSLQMHDQHVGNKEGIVHVSDIDSFKLDNEIQIESKSAKKQNNEIVSKGNEERSMKKERREREKDEKSPRKEKEKKDKLPKKK